MKQKSVPPAIQPGLLEAVLINRPQAIIGFGWPRLFNNEFLNEKDDE